jgi:lipopolysaccharide/colanic/teichoic acid biosynthesis glycosyltransferase
VFEATWGFEEIVDLDIRYLETGTLWIDLQIQWRMAAAGLCSHGVC